MPALAVLRVKASAALRGVRLKSPESESWFDGKLSATFSQREGSLNVGDDGWVPASGQPEVRLGSNTGQIPRAHCWPFPGCKRISWAKQLRRRTHLPYCMWGFGCSVVGGTFSSLVLGRTFSWASAASSPVCAAGSVCAQAEPPEPKFYETLRHQHQVFKEELKSPSLCK